MLDQIINDISEQFIQEAKKSPHLFADMAAMEKYMAENYSERIFVELLQNADDCGSSQICVKQIGKDILYANNGRPFDENDIKAICRSGASSKERGKNIGYRGIGFKSTSNLTDEIIIYSNDTYFTFNKRLCAQILAKNQNEVPMIRIPIPVEKSVELKNRVGEFIGKGYNTVFIFKNAKISDFINELSEINNGYFIFLHNITGCYIDMDNFKNKICLKRETVNFGKLVSFLNGSDESWLICGDGNASAAFKYDLNNNCIIKCRDNEQLFHSYLPTYDKFIFPIKVNADFSTDPSRKHITLDVSSEQSIDCIAKLLTHIISLGLNGKLNCCFSGLFEILTSDTSFSKSNVQFKQSFKKHILKNCFITLTNGDNIPLNCYKILPNWLEDSEKYFLRCHSSYVRRHSAPRTIYEVFSSVDRFVELFSQTFFSTEDMIKIMGEADVVERMSPDTQGKIISKIIKTDFFNYTVKKESTYDINNIKILTDDGVKKLSDISISGTKINKLVNDALCNMTGSSEIEWFKEKTNLDKGQINTKVLSHKNIPVISKTTEKTAKPTISKWRSAEQQCMEIETTFGNTVIDVSKRNIGYDIESTTLTGEKRYIEVKSINDSGEFTITNNEYTAAHQYREEYYICLINQTEKEVKAIYINDPLTNLLFEKRIRQWEWVCNTYKGDMYTFKF